MLSSLRNRTWAEIVQNQYLEILKYFFRKLFGLFELSVPELIFQKGVYDCCPLSSQRT